MLRLQSPPCADEDDMFDSAGPLVFLPPDENADTLELFAMLDEEIAKCAVSDAALAARPAVRKVVRKPLAVISR
jgi:hypothetical protein